MGANCLPTVAFVGQGEVMSGRRIDGPAYDQDAVRDALLERGFRRKGSMESI